MLTGRQYELWKHKYCSNKDHHQTHLLLLTLLKRRRRSTYHPPLLQSERKKKRFENESEDWMRPYERSRHLN